MKRVTTIFVAIICISLVLTSCGSEKKEETKTVTIKPKSTSVKGDIGDYFEVVIKDYVLKTGSYGSSSEISVEVKRNDKDFAFSAKNVNPFGTNGGEDYHVGFGIELLGDSGPIQVVQATNTNSQDSDGTIALMKLKKGETGYIQWRVEKLDGLKSFQLSSALQEEKRITNSSSEQANNPSNDASNGGDCDQFMTDYEAFIDSYVSVLKKYKTNPTDASVLTEYTEMTAKASKAQAGIANCTDPKYAVKIAEFNTKIANAASGL